MNAILNAVGQYVADNKGALPASISSSKKDIGNAGADLCRDLVPTYLPALPTDPSSSHDGKGLLETECEPSDTYDTDYTIEKDSNGRITVTATPEVPSADPISITR